MAKSVNGTVVIHTDTGLIVAYDAASPPAVGDDLTSLNDPKHEGTVAVAETNADGKFRVRVGNALTAYEEEFYPRISATELTIASGRLVVGPAEALLVGVRGKPRGQHGKEIAVEPGKYRIEVVVLEASEDDEDEDALSEVDEDTQREHEQSIDELRTVTGSLRSLSGDRLFVSSFEGLFSYSWPALDGPKEVQNSLRMKDPIVELAGDRFLHASEGRVWLQNVKTFGGDRALRGELRVYPWSEDLWILWGNENTSSRPRLFSTTTKTDIGQLPQVSGTILALARIDDRLVMAVDDGSVQFFDVEQKAKTHEWRKEPWVWAELVGSQLVTKDGKGHVQVFDVASGDARGGTTVPHALDFVCLSGPRWVFGARSGELSTWVPSEASRTYVMRLLDGKATLETLQGAQGQDQAELCGLHGDVSGNLVALTRREALSLVGDPLTVATRARIPQLDLEEPAKSDGTPLPDVIFVLVKL